MKETMGPNNQRRPPFRIHTIRQVIGLLLLATGITVGEASQTRHGRYTRDLTNAEVVVPWKVSATGDFLSHRLPHHFSRSQREAEPLHYALPLGGENVVLELTPNTELLSPGMLIETTAAAGIEGSRFRRASDRQCLYHGAVRGEPDSRVALSTCSGLAGFVRMRRGQYLLEPEHGHDPHVDREHPHLAYLMADSDEHSCGTKGYMPALLAQREIRRRRQMLKTKFTAPKKYKGVEESKTLYLETLVVIDKTFLDYHKSLDVEEYVLTVLNMAYNLYHDATFGALINLVVVRMMRLEEEDNAMNIAVTADSEKTLDFFAQWQKEMNPGDDTHPNHHDVALLLTRIDICAEETICGLLGLAKMAGACAPDMQACICEDSGLKLGFVIAHEMAHTLGVNHDDVGTSGCNGTASDGKSTTVMHPAVSMRILEWSPCTRSYLRVFLDSGFGECLEDEPAEHSFPVADVLPGVMYGGDYQCKSLVKPESRVCDQGLTCESLNCYMEGFGCMETHTPPVAGTGCGEKKWCYGRQCLTMGERPGAVDGGWGEWVPWTECSRTCGAGVSQTHRECNNPQPQYGGRFCVGQRTRHRICASEPCEAGSPSFRDVQCSEFDDWVYPEDGHKHLWTGFLVHNENPCVLFCVNDLNNVAALKSKVADGTPCVRGMRDICISGICREIPCDLELESDAVEDRCGVCRGDGTLCDVQEGYATFEENYKTPMKVVDVPVGSRNIRMEETEPSRAVLVVKQPGVKEALTVGKKMGVFSVPGSRAWLGMVKMKQEALNIPGPITEPLILMVRPIEKATVHYSIGVPADGQRTTEFSWDFVEWSRCSAVCGPGTQLARPQCVEKVSGLVDPSYCQEHPKPDDKSRACDEAPCTTRWMLGDWQECRKCTGDSCHGKTDVCLQVRAVNCVKPSGGGEGETDVVPDTECAGTRPASSKPCTCRDRRTCQPPRGETVKDVEAPEELHMTVIPDDGKERMELHGKEVLKFLENVQKNDTDNMEGAASLRQRN